MPYGQVFFEVYNFAFQHFVTQKFDRNYGELTNFVGQYENKAFC